MKNPRHFLIATFAGITAACTVSALAMAPIEGNRTGSAAAFLWFGTMAAASAALTVASAADAISSSSSNNNGAKRRA
jgi:hypothetical protein